MQLASLMANCSGHEHGIDIEEAYENTKRTKSYEDVLEMVNSARTDGLRESLDLGDWDDAGAGGSGRGDGGGVRFIARDREFGGRELRQLLVPEERGHTPLRGLLRDYEESNAKARNFCVLLLRSISRARVHVGVLRRFVKTHKSCDPPHQQAGTVEQRRRMFTDLACVAGFDNPLSQPGLKRSSAAGGAYAAVIPRLRSLQRRAARHAGFVNFFLKVTSMGATLLSRRAARKAERRRRRQAQQMARLDAVARGAYVFDREYHTVGRMLERVNEEVEHGRSVVRGYLQDRDGRYPWEEVVRQLQTEVGWLFKQLEELEEHACMCLLTIRRVTKLLVQEHEHYPTPDV